MKKYSLIIALCLLASSILAQEIDEQKMKKDLKVAQVVLKGLVAENQRPYWSSKNAEAQYIEGFGVILNIPANNFEFNFPEPPPIPDFSEAILKGMEAIEKLEIIIEEDTEEIKDNDREAEREERKKELQLRQKELEQRAQTIAMRANENFSNTDSIREVKQQQKINDIKIFMLDYGHLMSQLREDEKILVMEKSNHHRFYYSPQSNEARMREKLSVEASMRDIKAFQSGEISRKEAENRIIINKGKEKKELPKDILLFQNILERIYQPDLSETYFIKSNLFHEQIDGLGTIFYMDMISSIENNLWGLWRESTPERGSLNQQQVYDLTRKKYPEFEASLLSNILEYGKNISSLLDEEQLIFKVATPKCNDCEIPETIEIKVNGKILKELKSGKLNEKQAVKNMKVVKGDLQ